MKYLFFKFNYQLFNYKLFINYLITYISKAIYTYNTKHTVKILLSLVNYLLRNNNFHKKNEYSEIIYIKY